MRIDLHMHSIHSDGDLIPAEVAREAVVTKHSAIAITDHVDMTNVDTVVPAILKAAELSTKTFKVIPGVEITHVPPKLMDKVIDRAVELGIKWIVVHGETIAENVAPGTNMAAVKNPNVNVLAHPGFITAEEMKLAKKNHIYIEISGRKGHSLTNGYVANLARKVGAEMLVNSDAHSPGELMDEKRAYEVALGAGLTKKEADRAIQINPKNAIKGLI